MLTQLVFSEPVIRHLLGTGLYVMKSQIVFAGAFELDKLGFAVGESSEPLSLVDSELELQDCCSLMFKGYSYWRLFEIAGWISSIVLA